MPSDPDFLRDFRRLDSNASSIAASIAKEDALKRQLSDNATKTISPSVINDSPIVDRYDAGYYTKFKRLPILDPYNPYDGAQEYLFFTRPDLNVSGASNPLFTLAKSAYPELLVDLESSNAGTSCKFCPILSNAVSSSLDLPDLESSDIETGQNVYGTKIYYRGTSRKSDEEFEFNLEFEDTKQSEIYMFFKLWDEYKKLDWEGLVETKTDYIMNKVLCDQISIFKIIVANDGYTILFWANVVGCYPKGVPRSVWNDANNLNNYLKITTSWRGHFIQDNDPNILVHFNKLSIGKPAIPHGGIGRDIPIYDANTQQMVRTWSSKPYICMISGGGKKANKHPFQLRWSY